MMWCDSESSILYYRIGGRREEEEEEEVGAHGPILAGVNKHFALTGMYPSARGAKVAFCS